MEDFSREALARLPLADAVLHLWRYVADEAFLDSLYERNRGRCYVKVISFPNLVQLMASALLEHDGCGRASFEIAQENGTLDTSVWAVFQKLGNTPLAVSQGLLAEGTMRLMQIFPDHDHAGDIPTSLAEFEIIPLDGKAIKKVAKRIKPLRGVSGGLLGGRALVAMHLRTGMALAMATHEDGDANDARFMPELLEQVRELVPGCRLYVGDRQYCDLVQAERFTQQGDHFLVRYHCKNTFTADTKAGVRKGRDQQGRAYTECWGWMGSDKHPKRRYVRRIVLQRPGEENLILITDLLDADRYPADDLLSLYLLRWTIEKMFQQVSEVFHLRRLIGTKPKATVFQFAFCLLLYNMIQVIRAYVAQGQELPLNDVSTEKLFDDVADELIAWNKIATVDETIQTIQKHEPPQELQEHLRQVLADVWRSRWTKSPKRKLPETKDKKRPKRRTHGSVFRILEDHRLGPQKRSRSRASAAQRC